MCSEPDEGWFVIGGFEFVECGEAGDLITILGIIGVVSVWFGCV